MKKVYIILVNWNGWRDTIECLESAFRLNHPRYAVLVCDNASADGSLDRIAAWANGEIAADCGNLLLRHLTDPPLPKPMPFLRVGPHDQISLAGRTEKLVLVQTGGNAGFAAANNVGLRIGLAAGDLDYAWLLNSDTVVDPGALTAMLDRMSACPKAGICGSTLLYYDDPERVQVLGGSTYNRWTARVGRIGAGLDLRSIPKTEEVERRMALVQGASMLVSRHFVEMVGLMEERYFLFCEEIDWATRAKKNFSLAYARGSLVYHKEGGSTGSKSRTRAQNLLVDYYGSRSRFMFTLKCAKLAVPTVLLAIGMSILRRVSAGRFRNAFALAQATIHAGSQLRISKDRGA